MKIVLAADGSKFSGKALTWLLKQEWVHGYGVEILIVNVRARATSRPLDAEDKAAQQVTKPVFNSLERQLKRYRISHRSVSLVGDPAAEIVKLAKKEGARMIVMGTRGQTAIKSIFMGSVAQGVVTKSPIPVLLVK
ncbi:universal stress protein [Comamonas sp. Tr-654]|uniref:universal stress protein n=1 Tax=Comamonas sp. Tr-654 TaxID=2608341 RepID=UPI0014212683|nr:universal stress protein [Comamonas sp. Tr-654]